MRGMHVAQFSRKYSASPMCLRRHGRVPVVGHTKRISDTCSNRHGRVPVVGFSILTYSGKTYEVGGEVATAMATKDPTVSARTNVESAQ